MGYTVGAEGARSVIESSGGRRGIDSCVGHASPFLERAATCGIELNY